MLVYILKNLSFSYFNTPWLKKNNDKLFVKQNKHQFSHI